jgi:hypothetical protein
MIERDRQAAFRPVGWPGGGPKALRGASGAEDTMPCLFARWP